MTNIIVPIVEDVKKFEEFVKKIARKENKVFVGIRASLAKDFALKSKFVEMHIFDDKSKKEEIINALHSCKKEKGKLLIVRRPLLESEFTALTKSTKDIAILKAKTGNFAQKMKNFVKSIINKIFAFSYFDDISAICYGESMFELLSVCQDLSMASRVNKYVGVEIDEIETEQKSVKKDYNKCKAVLNLLAGILFFLASLAGGICICIFTTLQVLIVFAVIAWIFIALVIMAISIINFMRTIAVGDLHFGRAEEK